MTVQVVTDTLVVQHHSLGTTCRTTGVNQVSQVIGRDIGDDSTVVIIIDEFFHIDCLTLGNSVHTVGSRNDVTRLAVLENQFHTVSGILGITGDVSGT